MKNVVYIIGAGATQAEVSYAGGQQINVLMKTNKLGPGISELVLKNAKKGKSHIRNLLDIKDETDIEKLITLLTETGASENQEYANKLRESYYRQIIDRINQAGVLHEPELAIGLLQVHSNIKFTGVEELLGIISLNHDNLFQEASQTVHGCSNLGFDFTSDDFNSNAKAPVLIQLHGSFSWRKRKHIHVLKLNPEDKYDPGMTWIPPSILKETKDYPFNKLTGLAYELLTKCDILRIIGCSMSQNDWNLISLIFNAQSAQFRELGMCFKIQLIMDIDDMERFKKDISYLKNIIPIGQLEDGDFSPYKDPPEKRPKESQLDNPFKYWLKTKVNYHIDQGQFDNGDMKVPLKEIIGI